MLFLTPSQQCQSTEHVNFMLLKLLMFVLKVLLDVVYCKCRFI